MYFIVVHHCIVSGLGLNEILNDLNPTFSVYNAFLMILNSFVVISVNVFFLISGYFGINFRKKKIASLLYEIAFCSILVYVGLAALGKAEITVKGLIKYSLLSINIYWFAIVYIALVVTSPALNCIWKYVIEPHEKETMVGSFLCFCVLCFVFSDTPVATIATDSDAERIGNEVDIFVSGGDQIWNPYVTIPGFMLDFVPKEKNKISYGTSVGVKTIPSTYIETYKKYLARYNAISVREEQSAIALQPILNKHVDVVLDPTLLFSGKEWSFLMSEAVLDKEILKEPYILAYFVGTRKDYWKYLSKIKKETGYNVIVVPINDQAYLNDFKKYVKVSPAEFLLLIKNAEIICTDSFHATVFSILFGKEFYTLKRFSDSNSKGQNGRLEYLLSKYGLSDRLIKDESHFERTGEIDYKQVFKIIEEERVVSKQWLKKALEI